MSDPTGERYIDQSTGTALPSTYTERQGDVGPSVLRLNLEEQREELAATMRAIRRRVSGVALIVAACSLAAGVAAIVVAVRTASAHRASSEDDAGDAREATR